MAVVLLETASPPPHPPCENAAPPPGGSGVGCASAWVGGSGPARAASTNGSSPSPSEVRHPRERRRTAWGLRTGHRPLVGDLHDSVACCGLGRLPIRGEHPDDAKARLVVDCGEPNSARSENPEASLLGVTRCSSPWACPVCAPRIAAARAEALRPQVAELMAAGWTAHLVTLTVRHARHHQLADLWEGLGRAWSRLTSGKRWAALRAIGQPEYARGYDLTWSERHGWHPHVHLSLYLPPAHGDGGDAARWVLQRWAEVLGRLGWEAAPDAQHAVRVDDPAAAAAYAVTPAAVYETLSLATKRSRTGKAGRTPFEILGQAVDDVQHGRRHESGSVMLWREYVAATKGKRQVTTSRGLHLRDDEEDVENRPADTSDHLAALGPDTIRELDRARAVVPLMELAEVVAAYGPDAVRDAVREVLVGLRATDWHIIPPVLSEVVWPVPEPEPDPASVWPSAAHPPLPLPSLDWQSPVSDDGRLWRRVTPDDRRNLYLMERAS